MSAPTAASGGVAAASPGSAAAETRKEKRKALKKQKRKQIRQAVAIKEREEEAARSNDPEEQRRVQLREQEEAEAAERDRRTFEERERVLIETAAARRAAEEAAAKEREAEEEAEQEKKKVSDDLDGDDEWEYVEEGPAEIIWQGNEIIVKKKKVRIGKRSDLRNRDKEDDERPISNPLPPQSAAFASYKNGQSVSAQDTFENVAEQVPNFGTEQDKTHCPFHLKTGVCRFGTRCSRAHFYPDKSCTLLIKNMYTGPGLAWEQDEGLEYTDEEVEHCYEEFYEDVHTEFLKFGELVNFKVCKNGLHHLRGNVYVHYKSMESALLTYNTINGRFFAGKQISCEFVGVSRWKIAICGEYMKSKSRTCSRGSACNFIHPFHNPGGDYEWADWDNPPPKYWMKKMAFLFGPSVEAGYEEEMRLKERERPWDFNRKMTPTNNRHQSRRSTHSEMDMHNTGSVREHGDEKRDSQSPRWEHSSTRRKGTYHLHKHGRYEENDRTDSHGYNVKHHTRSSDDDNCQDQARYFPKKYPKHGEKNVLEDHDTSKKHKREEEPSRQKEREVFHEQGKQKKRHRSKSHRRPVEESRSSGWISESIYDNEERRHNTSSEDSYGEHGINVKERYDGRYGSTDLGSDKHSHEKTSRHSKYCEERTDLDRYSSRHHRSCALSDHELDRKNSGFSKQDSGDHDEYRDGRKITDRDPDFEETDSCLRGDQSSRSLKKQNKSDRKRKHKRKNEEYCKTREQGANSDSDNMESNVNAYKKHSRSRTPIHSSVSSRRERSRGGSKE